MESFIESSTLSPRQKSIITARYIPLARSTRRKHHLCAWAYWVLSIYNIIASAFMAAYPSTLAGSALSATLIGATVPVSLTLLASFKIPQLYQRFGQEADKMEELIWDVGESGDFTTFQAAFVASASRRREALEIITSKNINEQDPSE